MMHNTTAVAVIVGDDTIECTTIWYGL